MDIQTFSLIVLIVATPVYSLSAVAVSLVGPISFMAFDSGESLGAWLFVGIIFSYPLVVVGTLIAAWLLYCGEAYTAALSVSLLPFINPLALALLFKLMPQEA